jgi:hypothetical protein
MDEPDGAVRAFTIDGAEYPIPQVATFDMDEAEILWDYTQFTLPDFGAGENGQYDEARVVEILGMMRNPRFLRTLLHVAYRRGNPDASKATIEKAVGRVSNVEALSAWVELLEGDAGPPAQESTSEPTRSSPSSTVDSNGRSGHDSPTTTDEPDSHPESIGATR